MYSSVVWSINIMMAILMAGVSATIVWIFKYDDWNPNPTNAEHHSYGDDAKNAGVEI